MRLHLSPQHEQLVTAFVKAGIDSDRADEMANAIIAAMPTAEMLGKNIETIITKQVADAEARLAREIGSNYEAKLVAARGSARNMSLFAGFLGIVGIIIGVCSLWMTDLGDTTISAHIKEEDDKLKLLIAYNDTALKSDVKLVTDNHKVLREKVDKLSALDGGSPSQVAALLTTCTDGFVITQETEAATATTPDRGEGNYVGCAGGYIIHATYVGETPSNLEIRTPPPE